MINKIRMKRIIENDMFIEHLFTTSINSRATQNISSNMTFKKLKETERKLTKNDTMDLLRWSQ